jgi:hypothetical protein
MTEMFVVCKGCGKDWIFTISQEDVACPDCGTVLCHKSKIHPAREPKNKHLRETRFGRHKMKYAYGGSRDDTETG